MKAGVTHGIQFLSDHARIFSLLTRRHRWLAVSLGILVATGDAAATRGAAMIEGIRMMPRDNSVVPHLLIEGEPDKPVTIEYTDALPSGPWKALTNVVLTTNPFTFVDVRSAGVGRRFYRLAVSDVPLANPDPDRFVWIRPGKFTMGSPAGEQDRLALEGPQTVVTLSNGFYLGKFEVTQREYLAVLGTNPSYFAGGRILTTVPPQPILPPPLEEDLDRPVEWVSWTDATNYCAQLTQKERKAGRLPIGWDYRLPTEAQWEYACRAGTKTRFHFGDDSSYVEVDFYAWCFPRSAGMTHTVGLKLPNAWGLYDMAGNVGEWCSNWYASYSGGSVTDPTGPLSGAFRVIRGGSWFYYAVFCRSAYRYYSFPDYKDGNIGFRVILAPSQP